MADTCTHLDQIRPVKPKAKGCEECLKTGDTWLHLRLCLSCGHVGCCDSSKNWMWCYIDEVMFEED
jgi:hypothetical protein